MPQLFPSNPFPFLLSVIISVNEKQSREKNEKFFIRELFDILFEHFKQQPENSIQLSRASKAFKNKVEIRMMNINKWEVECGYGWRS